jgi:hypothetical protein
MARARAPGEWALAVACLAGLAACSDSAKPLGHGDNLIVDNDATTGEQAPMTDASGDSPIGAYVDVNALPQACSTCTCDTTTQFCFGGGGSAAPFSGTCDQTAGPLAVGCNALPGACANEPSCPCILQALAGQLPCTYPVCSDTNFSVSCR